MVTFIHSFILIKMYAKHKIHKNLNNVLNVLVELEL